MLPSTASQVRILCAANLRMARTKVGENLRRSKLLVATVGLFCFAYLGLGYLLFSRGLGYLSRIPGIGTLANERILFLLYFFFFVMLVFSNGVIGYASLFRNRVTAWMLTLPVNHRSVFLYRVLETLVISSWGLVFLSAPLLAAYGRIYDVPASFYAKALVAYVPFLAIPAAIAAWLLIIVVRFLNRWWIIGAALVLAVMIARAFLGDGGPDASESPSSRANITLTFNRVLDHTRVSTHPFVPSSWMSEMLLQWSKDRGAAGPGGGWFHFLLLSSYALMGGLLTADLASRGFYAAWIRSVQRRASLAVRRGTSGPAPDKAGASARSWPRRGGFPGNLLPLPRAIRAIVRKDVLTFRREPSQWAQVSIVLGLLLLYVLNLGNIGHGYDSPFWLAVICYLNLGVCALALSTLTTRFIFPMFSLEGQRLWILGLAPLSLDRVVKEKFWLGFAVTGLVTLTLIGVSGIMLGIPASRTLYYMTVIALMSFALTALAVGLGTLFPNLKETNPAKIVSGFGGTLCLILSFVYIVLCITVLVLPEARAIAALPRDTDEPAPLPPIPMAGLAGACALSLGFGLPPLLLSFRRVKKLDFFG